MPAESSPHPEGQEMLPCHVSSNCLGLLEKLYSPANKLCFYVYMEATNLHDVPDVTLDTVSKAHPLGLWKDFPTAPTFHAEEVGHLQKGGAGSPGDITR